MVKLRLRRKGRKKAPTYDIVAVDSRSRRDGDYLERIGYYDPIKQPSTVSFQHDRAIYWLNNGAQPTDIVRSLMSADGLLLRRQMEFKGKTAEEIEAAIAKHRDLATARYLKKQAARKARKLAAAAAAAAAPVDEAAPAPEAAPVEEPMNSTEDMPPAEPSAEQSES